MTYLRRQSICDRLRLGVRQSYRIVGSSYGERIASTDVIDLLNRSRRGISEPLDFIPSDLLTPDETAFFFADSEITKRELMAWTRRKKNIVPHFRLNSHTIRFSTNKLREWLDSRSRIRRFA